MLAVRRTGVGVAELVEVDEPVAGDGDVLVDLRFAAVNPFDMQVLRGEIGDASRMLTLGTEGTGHVDGTPVQVSGGGLGVARDGTFAPRVAVPASAVRPLPEGADLGAMATLGVAGRTGWRAVHQLAQVGADDVVLVLGASGGVGSYAAQLARTTGAQVLAHSGNPDKREYLEGLGARAVVADDAATLAEEVRDAGVSVVLDPLGGDYVARLLAVVAPRTRIVTYGVLAGDASTWDLGTVYRKGIHVLGTSGGTTPPEDSAAALEGVWDAVRAGDIVPAVTAIPLSDGLRPFDLLAERGVTGKLLLDMGEAGRD